MSLWKPDEVCVLKAAVARAHESGEALDVKGLAETLKRGVGGIKSQIRHMHTAAHKAYDQEFAKYFDERGGTKRQHGVAGAGPASKRLGLGMPPVVKVAQVAHVPPLPPPPPPSTPTPPGPFVLNEKQLEVLRHVRRGANVLVTGAAGTGKTALLGELLERSVADGRIVNLTASTGIAAMTAAGKHCAQTARRPAPGAHSRVLPATLTHTPPAPLAGALTTP